MHVAADPFFRWYVLHIHGTWCAASTFGCFGEDQSRLGVASGNAHKVKHITKWQSTKEHHIRALTRRGDTRHGQQMLLTWKSYQYIACDVQLVVPATSGVGR